MNAELWPIASPLTHVDELRILASALDGVAFREVVLEHPFDDVWDFVGDIERSVPTFDHLVTSLTVTARDGAGVPTRIRVGPLRMPMTIDMHHGWCLMVAPMYLVGMAAQALDPGHTLYGHLEGIPPVGPGPVRRLLRRPLKLLRRRHHGHVRRDVDGITHELARH